MIYHLQATSLKILNIQEDYLCIPKRAKVKLLSPMVLLSVLVTIWGLNLKLLSGTYYLGNSKKVCENCLKFQQSLVCIVISRVILYQRFLRYLRNLLLVQVKDFDQNLHQYYSSWFWQDSFGRKSDWLGQGNLFSSRKATTGLKVIL